ncbi:hypothetical protein ACH6EH_01655 [Paenibacillus sp. JSM ZJ436]|uniref:hypothetical protein n=1 Tax=Paenibacillus sp. JSM ZJ436 TaxID=3376190 RepID=UPI00379AB2E8
MMKNLSVFLVVAVVGLISFSSNIFAASWYAGVTKSGYTYNGVAAQIKTPTSLPTLGSSGESAWVSNLSSSGDWVQTGIRYYSGYTGFKTYIEHNISGGYGLDEIGTHVLDFTVRYRVAYDSADSKWHGFIADVDKGSWTMSQYQNVQSNAESHATNTQHGPFNFIELVIKDSSGWNWNTTKPTAKSPYSVNITDNANFRVYGP